MARPTKQAKATRKLLDMVLAGIDDTGLRGVETFELIERATALALKTGDRQEQELLDAMIEELSQRDLAEVGAGGLLRSAVELLAKGGERAKDSEMKRSELAAEASATVANKKRSRC